MARLAESPETIERIRQKAAENAQALNTHGKRAHFTAGPVILDFESQCKRLKYLDTNNRVQ